VDAELRVLDAARSVVDEVNALIARSRPRLLYETQLQEAAGSITSNIREGYGRRRGPERNQFFRFARGSAEEADERLRANFAAKRVHAKLYWRFHNRLTVIMRMLSALMSD
jgi:four helix bundle protein